MEGRWGTEHLLNCEWFNTATCFVLHLGVWKACELGHQVVSCMFSYCSQDLAVNVVCSSVTYLRATGLLLHVKGGVSRRRGHVSWDALPDGMGLGLAGSSVPEQASGVSLCSCSFCFNKGWFGFCWFPYHMMYGPSPYFSRAAHDCCRVTLPTDSGHFLCWNSGLQLVPHCIAMAYASEVCLVVSWNGSERTLEIEVL